MISKMLELSERYETEAILTIIRNDVITDIQLSLITETLLQDYPFLKITVDGDVKKSLSKLNAYNRKPKAILGERILLDKAVAACKVMQIHDVERVFAYVDRIGHICEQAVQQGDFESFRSHLLYTEEETVYTIYKELRVLYG